MASSLMDRDALPGKPWQINPPFRAPAAFTGPQHSHRRIRINPEQYTDRQPCAGRQTHESVEAELIDPAAHEIVQPRLSDPEPLRSLGLRQLPFVDHLPDGDHDIGSRLHVRRFGGWTFDGVPDALEPLFLHCRSLRIRSLTRAA